MILDNEFWNAGIFPEIPEFRMGVYNPGMSKCYLEVSNTAIFPDNIPELSLEGWNALNYRNVNPSRCLANIFKKVA